MNRREKILALSVGGLVGLGLLVLCLRMILLNPLRELDKRTALVRKLKEIFHRHRSQPVRGIINEINPILQGWVNYFRMGNSAECFSYVRHWVERKMVKHMARARKRRGTGWKGWSTQRLHAELGLFNDYQIRYWRPPAKVPPTG